jgi:hypothetical protein
MALTRRIRGLYIVIIRQRREHGPPPRNQYGSGASSSSVVRIACAKRGPLISCAVCIWRGWPSNHHPHQCVALWFGGRWFRTHYCGCDAAHGWQLSILENSGRWPWQRSAAPLSANADSSARNTRTRLRTGTTGRLTTPAMSGHGQSRKRRQRVRHCMLCGICHLTRLRREFTWLAMSHSALR